MENVEEQILSYPHLPVEKQREIESYVESHPEWAPLLRDVRSIESFIRDAGTESSSDTLVTTYVVVEHLHPGAVPSGLKETFRRLEKEMEGNSTLRKRVQSARRRLEEAEAALDPVTHFEELSGHAFETDAKESSTTADPTASTGKETRGTGSSFGAFVDELLRVPTPLRWAGAAAALLLGAYGTLFVVSQSSQSTLDRLAVVDVSNQVVDNYTSTTTRSATPSPDTGTAGQLYVEALTAVQSARTSTLGLFPSYDAGSLDRAEQLLQKVLDRSDRGSFLALEAHFYLGKVCLAQRQVDEARSHFKTVVKREGRMAEESQDILETLHKEYATGGPNAG